MSDTGRPKITRGAYRVTARRDGHGGHTPQCADCGAWLQTWGPERWRCPWTTAGDTPPPDGHFLCGRPYTRRTTADAARAFGIASSPAD